MVCDTLGTLKPTPLAPRLKMGHYISSYETNYEHNFSHFFCTKL